MNIVRIAQARTIAQLQELYYEGPEATDAGIVCGQCTDYHGRFEPGLQVRHASVTHVSFCYDLGRQMKAESEAEAAAELRNERYFENGCRTDPWDPEEEYERMVDLYGYGSPYGPR